MPYSIENRPTANSGVIRRKAVAASLGFITFFTAACATTEAAPTQGAPAHAEASATTLMLACQGVERLSSKDLAVALVTSTAVQGSTNAYTATQAASEALSKGFCIEPYELPEGGSAVTCLVATNEEGKQYTAYCLMTMRKPQ